MTPNELEILLKKIEKQKFETQDIELKSARNGYPTKLYDTLSSFSNRDDGGIIVFGVDEKNNFEQCGVYDAQDLQKHITEQCNQMKPKVRPVFCTFVRNDKVFVSVEIPGIDISERPCFYEGRGRLKGSYVRIGDADEPMTEYEIYSYEAFRKKYQDDIRVKEYVSTDTLNKTYLQEYLLKLKINKPNLSKNSDEKILELMNMIRSEKPTLAAILLFGEYPQAYFPQLCITAIAVPGREVGDVGDEGERFIDNKRIDGTLPQMLEDALAFIRKNTKLKTVIHASTGEREDRFEYPPVAVREAVLNALIHRDYSIHTEGMPIQIIIFEDRLEIRNPGGLYGRISIDMLGKMQADTRNPVLALAMEVLEKTENRYSGIPTIYRELEKADMPPPVFKDAHGNFSVCFYKKNTVENSGENEKVSLLEFCREYKTRKQIADFLGLKTIPHAIKNHVMPLIQNGQLEMEYPDKPRSSKQRYRTKSELQR